MEKKRKEYSWAPTAIAQTFWAVVFMVMLLVTAAALTFVGVAIQGGKWDLFPMTVLWFGLSAAAVYWMATRVRVVTVGEDKLLLESAAVEKDLAYEDIERLVLLPRRGGWRVVILCKNGGGIRLRARTREWAELLSKRAGVPLEELEETAASPSL